MDVRQVGFGERIDGKGTRPAYGRPQSMNEPIVFKRSVLMGQLVLMQLLVPPLVAIGMLYALTVAYDVRFDAEFRMLAILIAILAPLVMKRPQGSTLTVLP